MGPFRERGANSASQRCEKVENFRKFSKVANRSKNAPDGVSSIVMSIRRDFTRPNALFGEVEGRTEPFGPAAPLPALRRRGLSSRKALFFF